MKRFLFKRRLNLYDIIYIVLVAYLNYHFRTGWFIFLLALLMAISCYFEESIKNKI